MGGGKGIAGLIPAVGKCCVSAGIFVGSQNSGDLQCHLECLFLQYEAASRALLDKKSVLLISNGWGTSVKVYQFRVPTETGRQNSRSFQGLFTFFSRIHFS